MELSTLKYVVQPQMYNLTVYHGGLVDQLISFVLVFIDLVTCFSCEFGNVQFDRNRKMAGSYAHK